MCVCSSTHSWLLLQISRTPWQGSFSLGWPQGSANPTLHSCMRRVSGRDRRGLLWGGQLSAWSCLYLQWMNIVYKWIDVIISAWNVIGALKALTRALTSHILSGPCSTSIALIPQLVLSLCFTSPCFHGDNTLSWCMWRVQFEKEHTVATIRNCFCIQQLRLQSAVFEFHRRQRNWRLKCTLIRQSFGHTLAIRSDLRSHWSLHCLSFRIASAVSSVRGWCWWACSCSQRGRNSYHSGQ
jgi:hypothetical protein